MTADPLCRRVDGYVASPLERTEKITSHTEGVVHHHAYSLAACHLYNRLIIRNIEGWVSDVLEEDGLGAAVYESLEVGYMVALCEAYLDAHVTKSDREHGECTAIKIWLCHDVVSRTADVCHGEEYG